MPPRKTSEPPRPSVVSDQYQKVINETETQKGKIYFRREGGEIQMAVDFVEPDRKYVIYSGGKVQVYQPKIDQVNEYNPGKNRSEVESFLVLGFGGGGHGLLKSYDVKFLGPETVNGIETEKAGIDSEVRSFKKQYCAHFALDRPSPGSFGAAAIL